MKAAGAFGVSSDVLGHPRGLCILFLTEMWERFSFYGMRGLLIFYLTWHFLYERQEAYGIYAAYASLNYIGPVIGGALADRFLGFRKAVILGAILLTCGHLGMALEGPRATQHLVAGAQSFEISPAAAAAAPASRAKRVIRIGDRLHAIESISILPRKQGQQQPYALAYRSDAGTTVTLTGALVTERAPLYSEFFYLSLAFLVLGVAFLKPSISSIVGRLYSATDPRRDAGFTLFYLGINVGSALGLLITGFLAFKYGWPFGFGVAGIGMIVGLIIFLAGQNWLEGAAEPPAPQKLRTKWLAFLTVEHTIYIGAVAAILAVHWLLQHLSLADALVNATTVATVIIYLGYILFRCNSADRSRMLVLLVYIFVTVLFFALFDQAPSSLSILADEHVDLRIAGMAIPAPQLQALNPLLIVLLAPMMGLLWSALGKRGIEPSTSVKIALGLVLVAVGYFVLIHGINARPEDQKIALIWIVFLYLFLTLGELLLSPTGLSAVTKLAVRSMVGFSMGAYFLSYAYAQHVAGFIAKSTAIPSVSQSDLTAYVSSYGASASFAIAAGVALLCISPFLEKLARRR